MGDACSSQRPPPEVATDLQFFDVQTILWSPNPGATAYNVYGGTISSPWSFNQACRLSGWTTTAAPAPEIPPVGAGIYFLVSGGNLCGEGSQGSTSAGQPRHNPAPCP